MRALYLWLADLILFVHGLIVLFNFGALPVIWVGYYRNWKYVRNLGFRAVHLALILFVAGEAAFGVICPLTTWENLCLTKAGVGPRYPRGCLAYWVDRLIFYDLSPWIFTAVYIVFLLLVLLTFIWVKPRLPWRNHGEDSSDSGRSG